MKKREFTSHIGSLVSPSFSPKTMAKAVVLGLSMASASVGAYATFPANEIPEAAPDAPLPAVQVERTLSVRRGQTIAQALAGAGFSTTQVKNLTKSLASQTQTRPFSRNDEITLTYTEGAAYNIENANFTFRPAPAEVAHVVMNGMEVSTKIEHKPLVQSTAVAVGRINDSLYQDATEAGLPVTLVKPFMDMFAFDIDYTRDIHPGDTFKITYETTVDDRGEVVKTGRILAAEFTVNKQTRRAFWWAASNEYLNEKGESKRKLLMRTPLEVYRISSGFGLRMHPVLGYSRMHKGTDFAAPTGTPVKASGDGTVTFEGWHGGHGNYIAVKHTATYSTAYGHLSRYAPGIKVGSRVKQGQIIAYVGSTGISTGPHLHYEVLVNNVQVDPMNTKLPTGTMMATKDKQRFLAQVATYQTRWNQALAALHLGGKQQASLPSKPKA